MSLFYMLLCNGAEQQMTYLECVHNSCVGLGCHMQVDHMSFDSTHRVLVIQSLCLM
jgi:hypothetical protein